jgi:hypothetical protein
MRVCEAQAHMACLLQPTVAMTRRTSAGRRGTIGVGAALLVLIVACSPASESSDTGSPAGEGASCTCELSYNGAKTTIACGSDACLGGKSFACGSDAKVTTSGASCTATSSAPSGGGDAGGTGSGSDAGGSGLPACGVTNHCTRTSTKDSQCDDYLPYGAAYICESAYTLSPKCRPVGSTSGLIFCCPCQ